MTDCLAICGLSYATMIADILLRLGHSGINTSASFNNSSLEVNSSATRRRSRSEVEVTSSAAAVAVTTGAGAAVIQNLRHQPRFATLNCINGNSEDNIVEGEEEYENREDHFLLNPISEEQEQRRPFFLCRTPPPNYNSLPVTPPPSYTPPSYSRLELLPSPSNSRDLLNVSGNVIDGDDAAAAPVSHQYQEYRHPRPLHGYQPQTPQPLRPYQVPEVPASINDGINATDEDYILVNGGGQRRRPASCIIAQSSQAVLSGISTPVLYDQERSGGLGTNGRYPTRNVATVFGPQRQNSLHCHIPAQQQQQQQQQLQQRRRKQRRRKLHLLQQQQQQHHHHLSQSHPSSNTPLISLNNSHNIATIATDSSDNTSSLSDSNDIFNGEESSIVGSNRDQRRRRRQRLLKLRDAYCPDLLNACSLILLQQQTSDSTVGSFTDTPAEGENDSSSDNDEEIPNQRFYRHRPQQHHTALQHRPDEATNRRLITEVGQQTTATTNLSKANSRHYKGQTKEDEEENQRLQNNLRQEMGQTLSIRRPRISLTWVLREQHQQQQQQVQQSEDSNKSNSANDKSANTNNNQVNGKVVHNNIEVKQSQGNTTTTSTTLVEKKRYRLKKSSTENVEPLNGYATTPTSYTNASTALGSQKFFSNQNLLEYHKDENATKPPSKDLLFVCTPQRLPDGFGGSTEALVLVKKRNEIRKKLAAKMAQFRAETQAMNGSIHAPAKKEATTAKTSLKSGSYSEPSLIAASEGNARRHRHRKRRDRNRPPKFGYDIKNVDEFLTKCSLATPANIPMVLSTSCILYQTRPGGYQTEISLPLGMVVNAVFKNQNWLYVQTPHAEEGYVNYTTCLPLGILPAEARKEGAGGKPETSASNSKTKACWETIGDVFPKPCGNMTDSEKEIHLRVGVRSRSEGARTPHQKNPTTDTTDTVTVISMNTDNTDCLNGNTSSIYGEQQVDQLYLRAASQPKLSEKTSYAQLKIIRQNSSAASVTSSSKATTAQLNDEYVTLQQQQHQQQKSMQKHHIHHVPAQKTYITRTFITNGHNGQHLHPKDMKMTQSATATVSASATAVVNNCTRLKNGTINISTYGHHQPLVQQQTTTSTTANHRQQHQTSTNLHHPHHHHQSSPSTTTTTATATALSLHHPINTTMMGQTTTTVAPRSILNAIRRSSAHCGQRQTLVAITIDYTTADGLTLQKGDIVTLCECRETKDHRQWFYVKTRDGRQGYIPAEVAGHGYL
ncbi:uncharacterized protein LOC142235935 [Haematobia irritans]|uniref:uncharacterized protein LOC142235935 n=1 Tax=Haematobia irritans TaxID=7368 RepID=UPI003F508E76